MPEGQTDGDGPRLSLHILTKGETPLHNFMKLLAHAALKPLVRVAPNQCPKHTCVPTLPGVSVPSGLPDLQAQEPENTEDHDWKFLRRSSSFGKRCLGDCFLPG